MLVASDFLFLAVAKDLVIVQAGPKTLIDEKDHLTGYQGTASEARGPQMV